MSKLTEVGVSGIPLIPDGKYFPPNTGLQTEELRAILEQLIENVLGIRNDIDLDESMKLFKVHEYAKELQQLATKEILAKYISKDEVLKAVGEDELAQKTDDIQEIDVSMNNAEVRNDYRHKIKETLGLDKK